MEFSDVARRLGISSGAAVFLLLIVYSVTLVAGQMSLQSPHEQIGDPYFTMLEVLIIVMMPAMVVLMVAVHSWAPAKLKVLSLSALVFMGLATGVTCSLHFAILTLSRQPAFSALELLPLFVSFEWPSVSYALDIVAWDVFFPLSMLFAAPVFGGSGLALSVRVLMIVSGVLSLAGLSGVAAGDMGLRNIGIAGYVGVFLVVALLLVVLFYRSKPQDERGGG